MTLIKKIDKDPWGALADMLTKAKAAADKMSAHLELATDYQRLAAHYTTAAESLLAVLHEEIQAKQLACAEHVETEIREDAKREP